MKALRIAVVTAFALVGNAVAQSSPSSLDEQMNAVAQEDCVLAMLHQMNSPSGVLAQREVAYMQLVLQDLRDDRLQTLLAQNPSDTVISLIGHACKKGMTVAQALAQVPQLQRDAAILQAQSPPPNLAGH